MTSLSDAFEYPMNQDEWTKTVLIGGVLSFFAFLVVPILAVYGYLVRVIRHRLDGDPQPPTFDEWEELLIDGVKVFAIGIVYLLIPMIVGIITVGGSLASIASGTRDGAAVGWGGMLLGLLLTLVLSLIFGYIAVCAIVNFAREEQLGAAFDFATIRAVVLTDDYAIAWLLSVAVFIGVGILTSVLNMIPILGAFIAALVGFYAQIVAAHLWTSGYSAAREAAEPSTLSDAEEPAI